MVFVLMCVSHIEVHYKLLWHFTYKMHIFPRAGT